LSESESEYYFSWHISSKQKEVLENSSTFTLYLLGSQLPPSAMTTSDQMPS